MKIIKKEIENKKNEIQKIKILVSELNIIIGSVEKEINIFLKNLNDNYEYNKEIINSYNQRKKNYYILDKIQNLNYISHNRIEELYEKINFKKYIQKINELKVIGDQNMWISERYCKEWKLKEGIRELLQNQYDAIISNIGTKHNLKIDKKGEINFNGNKKYLEYYFRKKNEDKIYGKIIYDKNKKVLSIINEGELFLADFLLGSLKSEENNPELIGKYGERMKIAILSLCRLQKKVTIISSKKKYEFELKKDEIFKKNKLDNRCLFCKISDAEETNVGNVRVIIDNICDNEWFFEIDDYLWLIEDDIEIYISENKNREELGHVIYDSKFKNKLYVKGIYIQEINKDKSLKEDIPGFNANDVYVNRDRNAVFDYWELKDKISILMANCFNKNTDYLRNTQDNLGKPFIKTKYGFEHGLSSGPLLKPNLKNATKNIMNCLNKTWEIYDGYTLSNNLSKESIDIIWKEWRKENGNEEKQPTDDTYTINKFLKEKNLNSKFYEVYVVSTNLMNVLKKSQNYISIYTKYDEYLKKSQIIEPNEKYKNVIKKIYSILKNDINNFKENNIIFKEFKDENNNNFCFLSNNNYIFSGNKLKEDLNEKWSFFIFIKIIELSEIKIENYYSLFRNFFKTFNSNI